MLLIEDVNLTSRDKVRVFWDSGSTTALIRTDFAKAQGLNSIPVTYVLTTVGGAAKTFETDLFFLKLVDRKGNLHTIQAYGIDVISTELKSFDASGVYRLFPGLNASQVSREAGVIDFLVGMEYAGIHPWK